MFSSLDGCKGDDVISPGAGQKDIYVQLVISSALGVSSFVAFCVRFVIPRCSFAALCTDYHHSFSVRDGKAFMLRESAKPMLLRLCQTSLTLSLAGCQCCTKLQRSKFLHLPDWTHLWYVAATLKPTTSNADQV